MITTGHVTIYNKYVQNRAEKWQRSVVRDVNWQATKAVVGLKAGQLASNVATIFIPFPSGTQYLAAKAWQIMQSLGTAEGFWTLQEGDTVVKGEVADEIIGAFTISDLRAKYDDVVTITSVDAMDMGSADVRHWEVGCK